MSKQRYYVDTSDRAFPTIRKLNGEKGLGGTSGVTLAEAKAEIIEQARGLVNHWQEVIRNTRALKATEIEE